MVHPSGAKYPKERTSEFVLLTATQTVLGATQIGDMLWIDFPVIPGQLHPGFADCSLLQVLWKVIHQINQGGGQLWSGMEAISMRRKAR